MSWFERLHFGTWFMTVVAIAAPLVIAIVAWADGARRRRLVARLGDQVLVKQMMATASPRRRLIKRGLLGLAVALIAFAAARPQTPGSAVRRGHGLDLVIALDASKSMMVDDVGGTRLARARAMVKALLGTLAGDRVAAVVFAGAAAHFPLTDDEDVALSFLGDLGPLDLPPGSNVAGALRTATCMLRPDKADVWSGECARTGGAGHGGDPLAGDAEAPPPATALAAEERGKVVLLITDGGTGRGEVPIAAVQQVRRAVELGVTVLVMGVGSEAGGEVPELDEDGNVSGRKRGRDGRPVVTRLDRETLGLLADAAGGVDAHYFELGTGGDPDPGPIVAALGRVKRGGLEQREDRVMIEHYPGFLFAGFMLLVIEACIGTRRRRPHPEAA